MDWLFARKVTPKLNFGLQFNVYRLFLSEENRSVSFFGAELGAQYLFTDRFVVGFHVMNPYGTGVKLSSEHFGILRASILDHFIVFLIYLD